MVSGEAAASSLTILFLFSLLTIHH